MRCGMSFGPWVEWRVVGVVEVADMLNVGLNREALEILTRLCDMGVRDLAVKSPFRRGVRPVGESRRAGGGGGGAEKGTGREHRSRGRGRADLARGPAGPEEEVRGLPGRSTCEVFQPVGRRRRPVGPFAPGLPRGPPGLTPGAPQVSAAQPDSAA